jgi:hypothetical protein
VFRRFFRRRNDEFTEEMFAQLADQMAERLGAAVRVGDTVIVLNDPATVARGVAGHTGECTGMTVPEDSGVDDVLGGSLDGMAVAVEFPDGTYYWFNPDLLSPVDDDG